MRLTYHPDAEADLIDIGEDYDGRSPGLAARFLREYEKAVGEVLASPHRWPIVEGELHCRTTGRFPFGIYYRIRGGEVRILIVKHHSRHPDYGRDRIDD